MVIDGVERTIRAEGRVRDARCHRVDATAAEIQPEQLVLCGCDKEEFGFGVEPNDALHRRQPAAEHAIDRGQPGEAIELRRPSLCGQPDRHAGNAGDDLSLANTLW